MRERERERAREAVVGGDRPLAEEVFFRAPAINRHFVDTPICFVPYS